MNTREQTRLSAVAETIVLDDLVGVAVLDGPTGDAAVRWANPAFAALLGRRSEELAGKLLDDVIDDPELDVALHSGDGRAERTVRLATAGGGIVLQLSPTDEDVVVIASPAHATPRAAMYDAVTGLASLALFREHLQLGLHRRAREGDDLAVVTVGVPDFAATWQRQTGAASLLQTRIAERIEQVVRDADVLAARRPGSFVLLVIDPTDAVAAATLVSERMLAAFDTAFALSDRLQRLALNIGIAGVAADDDPDGVLARADAALAKAATAGTDTYRILLGDD